MRYRLVSTVVQIVIANDFVLVGFKESKWGEIHA